MNQVRTYIESTYIVKREVFPVMSGLFSYSRNTDAVYYSLEMKDSIKFNRLEDYESLLMQYDDECDEITITIEILQDGSWVEFWEGYFSASTTKRNKDKCYIETKPEPKDDYKCLDENIKEEINIYSSGSNVSVTAVGGVIEEQECQSIQLSVGYTEYFTALNTNLDACLASPSDWCLKSNKIYIDGIDYTEEIPNLSEPFDIDQITTWHREVTTTDCSGGSPVAPTFGTGWILLNDDCASSSTSTYWRCPGEGEVVGDYDYGRNFSDVCSYIATQMGCSLSVKSDFFNINPLSDSPSNIAYTYANLYLHNLTIHQKSDVKNKNATNPSSSISWELKPEDFFKDLRFIFNVFHIVVDNTLILEHVSFFTTSLGLDVSSQYSPDSLDWQSGNNVKTEKFFWLDEMTSSSFKSNHIKYDCGIDEKTHKCALFSTDLAFIEDEDNNEDISNTGFVLISNGLDGSDLVINDSNLPLSWPELHENLHTYNRLYKSGKINNVQQDFDTWIPYIKQDKFKTDLCNPTTFNPRNLVTTNIGNGMIDSADYNIYTNTLELELLY